VATVAVAATVVRVRNVDRAPTATTAQRPTTCRRF